MKQLILLSAFVVAFCTCLNAQITCIFCYEQNDSISTNVTNLLQNGGFENTTCSPWPSADKYCPNSSGYNCDITNWTCTGGGVSTYACTFDNTFIVIPQGSTAVYFGNSFCNTCTSGYGGDTSCLVTLGCTMTGVPDGYPYNSSGYGGTTGVSLQQTVTGLTPGNAYVLEFWAGGEWSFQSKGMFAVDVGFGDTLLRDKPSDPGSLGTEYIIEFIANAASHTIKFTNWGHICNNCTELVLDNARLYPISQLSSTVPNCTGQSSSAGFAASDTDICEKFCINFIDSSTNNPTAWLWEFPGGSPPSSTLQNPINICYQAPGVYDVKLTVTSASGTDSITLPNYITVNATPPFPTITQVGYTLTSSFSNSYQWQLNSYDIPGATNQSYTILQTGYYTVVVGDGNGCKNSATQYVLISGVQEVNAASISISPNPSNGSFMVEGLNGFAAGDISLRVINTLGQEVFFSDGKITGADWKREIDLNTVSYGMYFLEVKTENIFVRKKIIISN